MAHATTREVRKWGRFNSKQLAVDRVAAWANQPGSQRVVGHEAADAMVEALGAGDCARGTPHTPKTPAIYPTLGTRESDESRQTTLLNGGTVVYSEAMLRSRSD